MLHRRLKILVLHNNFPAQFKFLLPDLVKKNHEVVFLSVESHGNKIAGVKHFKISTKEQLSLEWKSPYKGLEKKISVSELFRAAFDSLKQDGFYPEITIFHSGWGIGLYLKSIFPLTRSVAYAEWWFQWQSVEASFDPSSPFSPSSSLKERVSQQLINTLQATEISEADLVWTPTEWQKSQFPLPLQSRMSVIHEGVDTKLFAPKKQRSFKSTTYHITYSSRALEAMRCFDHFSKIIALVLKSDSRLKLTIVGKEKAVYRPLPKNKNSLLTDALERFTTMGVADRVNHYPRLNFDDYRRFMISSDLHFYFSRPFVASWSLLEAMSAGAALISNPTPMTNEFLAPKKGSIGAYMTNCLKHQESAIKIMDLINSPRLMSDISLDMRSRAEEFDCTKQSRRLREFIDY